MALWNPSKPLNQPPSFGRVGHGNIHDTKTPAHAHAAARAHQQAQFGRDEAVRRTGGRRAVVCE